MVASMRPGVEVNIADARDDLSRAGSDPGPPRPMSGDADASGHLSIGVVSKLTGVPVETLRTWERRYGYPSPLRTSGGHRVYPPDCVARLRAVTRALELGHRAASVVATPRAELEALIATADDAANADDAVPAARPTGRPAAAGASTQLAFPDSERSPRAESAASEFEASFPWLQGHPIAPWMIAARDLDESTLDRGFRVEWARLGTVRFLTDRATPFMEAVGEAWCSGLLDVCQEHFASERLRDFLAGIWRPLSDRSPGVTALCATLPGELHSLGLHMAACVAVLSGYHVTFLGQGAPVDEIAAAAQRTDAPLVLISVSTAFAHAEARHHLRALRDALPAPATLVAGGSGCPRDVPGVVWPGGLTSLWDYLRARPDSLC